jgi:hypothetical protein
MLTMVMHPMLRAMDGRDFALSARLPAACAARAVQLRKGRRIVISPAVAVFVVDAGGTPFILTAIGPVLTIRGRVLVSTRLAEPNYDVMLAWDPEAMPPAGRGPAGTT